MKLSKLGFSGKLENLHTNKGGSRRRKKVVSARFWNFLWLCFVWLIAFFFLLASFWFVPLSTCVSLFEREASNPHPHPNPNPHTQASRPLVFPLGRTNRPTDQWMDWQTKPLIESRVEMRERLCCQDAQSSPGTFQSSNRLQLTRFLVFGKNAKNVKKYKKI